MSTVRFGTGGWRALIADEFTKENVRLLAQAFAQYMMADEDYREKGVVLGYDRRFLSDSAAKWAAEVLAGNGVPVAFIPRDVPTPMIMYWVKVKGCPGGMAITASHNPADYNGIKIFTRGGRDATEEVTAAIERILDTLFVRDVRDIPFDQAVRDGIIKTIYPINEYVDSILSFVDAGLIRTVRPRVLLDPMYGSAVACFGTLFSAMRCEFNQIHTEHNPLFGGRLPAPSQKTLAILRDKVIEGGYDMGFATDGDGDRIGLIDEKGNFIHPNDIMALLFYYLNKFKGWKGDVVRNLGTTHLLDKLAGHLGVQCHQVAVGFKYVSSKMDETDAVIGGESSGGLTIRGHISGKDGVFAAALLVEMICKTGMKLSEMLDQIHKQFGDYAMAENAYHFTNEVKDRLQNLLFVEKKLPEFPYEILSVSYMDGLKVHFVNDGWILARFSGTEPLIRVFAEMDNMKDAKELCRIMARFLGIA